MRSVECARWDTLDRIRLMETMECAQNKCAQKNPHDKIYTMESGLYGEFAQYESAAQ